jgi:hypothetical protein
MSPHPPERLPPRSRASFASPLNLACFASQLPALLEQPEAGSPRKVCFRHLSRYVISTHPGRLQSRCASLQPALFLFSRNCWRHSVGQHSSPSPDLGLLPPSRRKRRIRPPSPRPVSPLARHAIVPLTCTEQPGMTCAALVSWLDFPGSPSGRPRPLLNSGSSCGSNLSFFTMSVSMQGFAV